MGTAKSLELTEGSADGSASVPSRAFNKDDVRITTGISSRIDEKVRRWSIKLEAVRQRLHEYTERSRP